MHIEEKIAMRNLAESRRWLNSNGLERRYLTDEERERRVREYIRQVAENGCIVAWLPPSEPRVRSRYSRFDDGDVLRPRQA